MNKFIWIIKFELHKNYVRNQDRIWPRVRIGLSDTARQIYWLRNELFHTVKQRHLIIKILNVGMESVCNRFYIRLSNEIEHFLESYQS